MCGIAGLVERPARAGRTGREALLGQAAVMAKALIHRGPDRQGSWADDGAGVALGHSRLSILDLSPLGDQPMESRDARFVVSFNGEIYNFRELRIELKQAGHSFRGNSDTEVMLAAFAQWGCEAALRRFDGMFAFALWDRELRELWLARDRLGEKPLYYGWNGERFVFASELKALRALPGFSAEVDREAIGLYFRYGCVPAPQSIYRGIRKLPAGAYFVLREKDAPTFELSEPCFYWRLKDVITEARPFAGGDDEAVAALDGILGNAVSGRRVSDVPLGAFLSGGVDSSLIVALMQARSSERVRTFTIGFEEADYNEADQARAIAKHLGTHHSEHLLRPADAMDAIPRMPQIYDEPFADSSQIATYLVARHARASVTVCLSGDAGDELFAGYHRHFWGARLWGALGKAPLRLRRATATALRQVPARAWRKAAGLGIHDRPAIFADQMRKLIDVLDSSSHRDLYQRLLSHQRAPEGMVIAAGGAPGRDALDGVWPGLESVMGEFQYADALSYLPNDILTKVDRATMAVGLEARIPFLDPQVIQFAWSLPERMKARDGEGKWILRRLLERYVPKDLVAKPKSGFRVPIGEWMRGGLRDWCEALLDERTLSEQGYLDAVQVRAIWQDHLTGRQDHEHLLWSILMLQAWLAQGP